MGIYYREEQSVKYSDEIAREIIDSLKQFIKSLPKYLSSEDVCKNAGISHATYRGWIYGGKIPSWESALKLKKFLGRKEKFLEDRKVKHYAKPMVKSLQKYMERRNRSAAWVSDKTGIGESTLYRYLSGRSLPDKWNFEILSDFLSNNH